MSVKDFRAIIQHAGATGSDLSARYSIPAKPIQFSYHGDGINCEFLLMTVGERGTPGQKTKKSRANGKTPRPELEAVSRRQSAAPSEPPHPPHPPEQPAVVPAAVPVQPSIPRISALRGSHFDLRPSQRRPPPPPALLSDGMFVEQENEQEWEPMRDEDDDEETGARLEWDSTNQQVSLACCGPTTVLCL